MGGIGRLTVRRYFERMTPANLRPRDLPYTCDFSLMNGWIECMETIRVDRWIDVADPAAFWRWAQLGGPCMFSVVKSLVWAGLPVTLLPFEVMGSNQAISGLTFVPLWCV